MKKLWIVLLIGIVCGVIANESDKFAEETLTRHNDLRKNHNAQALTWNPSIQAFAQEWADKLAKENKMYHRKSNKYGENIYWAKGMSPTGADATQSWYDEIKDYNFSKPGFYMSTGHFTQVVWVDSKELGCGKSKAKDGGIYIVCNYNPPGNYQGEFPQNVLPKTK